MPPLRRPATEMRITAMRGLWIEAGQVQLRDDLPVPVPAENEALLRVLRVGICQTDIQLLRGYHRFSGIPGHELVGRVEQGPAELLHRRVVCEINVGCGACQWCSNGQPNHCEQRRVLGIRDHHGACAEWCAAPVDNLHLVPDTVPTDAAVLTEPLAAALQVQEQVPVSAGDRVLVVGDGKLGLLVAQTLALTGCDLVVLGHHRAKLDILAARGITTCDHLPAVGRFDIAVECTGNPDGCAVALRSVRARGTLVLKSTYAGLLSLDASPIVVNEITVVGSRCGPFVPALQLLAEHEVDVESLIECRFPLADGVAAFAAAQARGALKVLLDMAEEGEHRVENPQLS